MEQRYQAVLAVIRDGVPSVEVVRRFGVSRQSVHSWLLRYEVSGMPGLMNHSHRPDGCEHQMSAEVDVKIIELRRRNRYIVICSMNFEDPHWSGHSRPRNFTKDNRARFPQSRFPVEIPSTMPEKSGIEFFLYERSTQEKSFS